MTIRKFALGIGTAVAERTILRPGEDWGDVAERVAKGNHLLHPASGDYDRLKYHLENVSILLSGRHLQHGDENQPNRPGEVFVNCCSAILRAPTFQLLLSGSGVGTCYDDDLQVVDLSKMPIVSCVIDHSHADGNRGYMDERAARHFYSDHKIHYFRVPDSREGWAAEIEQIELLAFHGQTNDVLLLDHTDVRPSGSPIKGMQNRPASGPHPLMDAITRAARIRGLNLPRWKQAMIFDHLLAECVLVGGARRAARIAIKYWKDPSIFEYIDIKRPIEYLGLSMDEIKEVGRRNSFLWSANNSVAVDEEFWNTSDPHAKAVFDAVTRAQYGDGTGEPGFLNVDKLDQNLTGLENYLKVSFIKGMSPAYDEVQRAVVKQVLKHPYKFIVNPCVVGSTRVLTNKGEKQARYLRKPFTAVFQEKEYNCSGFWSTGEQQTYRIKTKHGRIIRYGANKRGWVDGVVASTKQRLWVRKPDGYEDWFRVADINVGDFLIKENEDPSEIIEIIDEGMQETFDCSVDQIHAYIANGYQAHNCGEICLSIMAGVCVIGDLVPFFAHSKAEMEESARLITRALIRTNLMDQIYATEIKRTNRIGVGLTGIHEFAWKKFGYGFRDLIDEEKSLDFWLTLSWLAGVVEHEAYQYSQLLEVEMPHTLRTCKPSGTVSKLWGLTEGAHLPAMREYLRWVQFRNDDPLVKKYAQKGYPTRVLKTYEGTTIVGFPTQPLICTLGMGDALVTADEATPEEQFQWVRLLEKYWLGSTRGNQVSYTLKYRPEEITFEEYQKVVARNMPSVRTLSVLPKEDVLSYEYQPEESLPPGEYDALMSHIGRRLHEDVDRVHVDCTSGACPIDFQKDGQ